MSEPTHETPPGTLRIDPAVTALRLNALTSAIDDLGQRRTPMPPVWLAVMEWVMGDTAITLVSVNDGSTSLYFSHGGGFVGAGAHESVARASGQFLGECFLAREHFAPATGLDYPPAGMTRFYARTDAGQTVRAEAPEADLHEQGHPLHGPWAAAQAVIAQIRRVSSNPGSAGPSG